MANITKKKEQDTFLSELLEFQGSLNGESNLLDKLRFKGAEEVRNGRFPQPKDEDWRFISLKELYQDTYKAAYELDLLPSDFSGYYLPEAEQSRLVFVNGEYSETHSNIEALPDGVKIGNLADFAAGDDEHIEKHLNQYTDFEGDIFHLLQ
ncbi:MAG: hypothetical protein U5K69_20995 [Balneolaceae bacterium]|nr:hypothetical protein [Balneolaceae bacterium]